MTPTNKSIFREETRQQVRMLALKATQDINEPSLTDKEAFGLLGVSCVTLLHSIYEGLAEIHELLREETPFNEQR